MRKNRELKQEEVEYLLKLKESEVDLDSVRKLFADRVDGDARFHMGDTFTLEKGRLGNPSEIRTTAGRYVANLVLFEGIRDRMGYVNEAIDSKRLGRIMQDVTDLMLEEELTSQEYETFVNRMTWFCYGTSSFTVPPMGYDSLMCPPKTAALRKKLFSEHADAIRLGDSKVVSSIEKQLLASAREELRGTDIMDFYDSGAKGKFDKHCPSRR